VQNTHVSVEEITQRIVPISRFNKGEASKIFEEVRQSGTKVVFKNNDPVCVLMKPDEYQTMIDQLIDLEMAMEADRRLATGDGETISEADLMSELGITEEALDKVEVEIE
jgi:PHD/YefM family antitoxin component YafN of YafNO toxin-antitoxin module